MQTAASRRAFSFLASKVHPQLPLTPRESQQLLNLLTTSFRTHLDREHPPPRQGRSLRGGRKQARTDQREPSPARALSSHTSATQHLETILTNPLFALPPRRRGSGAARIDAQEVLRDPLGWFQVQVSIGAADISKAAVCLDILENNIEEPGLMQDSERKSKPGLQIAQWLWSSGHESSKEFLESHNAFREQLVSLLVREGEERRLWRWLTRPSRQRADETGLAEPQVLKFRAHLLKSMVMAKLDLNQAITTFLRATEMIRRPEYDMGARVLQPAGAFLVDHILASPNPAVSTELYDAFLGSLKSSGWAGGRLREIKSLLCLYHPSAPSAAPSLSLLHDMRTGAVRTKTISTGRRKLLVQVCLGAARQSLAEEKFSEAAMALEFARDNFPDLVSAPEETTRPSAQKSDGEARSRRRQQEEQENLQLLDGLLPS